MTETEPRRVARPLGLRIVRAEEQLRGVALPALERAARRCVQGDSLHRGLVHLGIALARNALTVCAPPSTHAPWLAALATAEAWTRDRVPLRDVAKARSDAFVATLQLEQQTLAAVRAAQARTEAVKHTLIDDHADLVVRRHAVLGATYAGGAVLLVCDGVEDREPLALVPQQCAGAIAYQSSGLGPARSQDVRAAACEQAEWELGRAGTDPSHGAGALAIQLFHEYLGAHWKDRSDAERARFDELAAWALASEN